MFVKNRKWVKQNIIPFDIDGIDVDRVDLYIEAVLEVLGLNQFDVGIVESGNGYIFLSVTLCIGMIKNI